MTGRQIVYPDTGLPAWWCICAENDCEAKAIGPFRSQIVAEINASDTTCDNAHFVTDRIGRGVRIVLIDEAGPLASTVIEHNASILDGAR